MRVRVGWIFCPQILLENKKTRFRSSFDLTLSTTCPRNLHFKGARYFNKTRSDTMQCTEQQTMSTFLGYPVFWQTRRTVKIHALVDRYTTSMWTILSVSLFP